MAQRGPNTVGAISWSHRIDVATCLRWTSACEEDAVAATEDDGAPSSGRQAWLCSWTTGW